jgi:hypothetical protein
VLAECDPADVESLDTVAGRFGRETCGPIK